MFFATSNLCSRAVTPCPTPWTFQAQIPDSVRGKENKKARDKWINSPTTLHQCYTAFEGFIPNERIRDAKAGDEGNQPLRLSAFVGDYDAPVTLDEIKTGLETRCSFVPNYLERTMSGNVRLVWIFEKPVSFPNARFAKEFLSLALKRTKFSDVVVGLDVPAWENPNRLWTNSGDWSVIDENARLPDALLNGWVVEVAEKHHWRRDRGAIDIPLPAVWTKLCDIFPKLPEQWPNEFVEGAQGPSFWIEGSESPKSAIVKPTGLFTFAGHAVKPFYSWADLLGKDFVDKYAAEAMGKAVQGIYHDGTSYYRQDGYGDWKPFSKEDTMSHLCVARGMSSQKEGSEPSEVSRAIEFIQNWQGITGAAPFAYAPSGILERNGRRILNTHTRRVLQPAGGPVKWGPDGQFPFYSRFFDGLFSTPEQLTYFLPWLSRFYKSAYNLLPESGHNVILVGGTNKGKTFLSQCVLSKLMGGDADAQNYLMGETTFNSELFESGLWTIDDNSVAVDAAHHRKFTIMFKKMSANQTFQYHAKFRVPCLVEWLGRVFVTANDDENSIRIVPDGEHSNMDKMMIFRTAATAGVTFPSRQELIAIADREGPYFARFLLDYEIPKERLGDARFGVIPYHDPAIVAMADQSSRTAVFVEILEDWRERYFSENRTTKFWQGTAFQFLRELTKDGGEAALRGIGSEMVSQRLTAIKAKGFPIEIVPGGPNVRTWRIMAPEQKTDAPLPVGTKFQK